MQRLIVYVTFALVAGANLAAQDVQFASADRMSERGPRFFLNTTPGPVRIDVAKTAVLKRRISVDFQNVKLSDALNEIARQAGLRLMWTGAVLPSERTVQLKAENITVAGALSEILMESDVDIVFERDGQAAVVKRLAMPGLPAVGTITGRVTEAKTGAAVPQAQVSVKGTSLRRTTDANGRYAIVGVAVGEHQVLTRRIGYAPMTKSANVAESALLTLDFSLTPAPTALSAVVSTVTCNQEQYKVGNVIGRVDADSVLAASSATSLTDVLSGRVAGVVVYPGGGLAGVGPPVRIRGTNSFSVSNDPILIVDGVRVESAAGSSNNAGFQGTLPGRINDFSPYEIESIDVVKGPSATTLYGSDAANGVIVIKTRRGSASASRWRGWTEQATVSPAEHFQPNYWGWGTNLVTGATAQRCVLSQVSLGACRQDSVSVWNPLEDKATSPIATGYRQVYGLQTLGGIQGFNYFLSGEYSGETGYLRMPDAEQERLKIARSSKTIPGDQVRPNQTKVVNLRANVESSIGENAHVRFSNGLVFNKAAIPGTDIFSNGSLNVGAPTANGGWLGNRPGEQFALRNVENTARHTLAFSGDYDPARWLSTRATVGLDRSNVYFDALQRNGEGPVGLNAGRRQDNRFDIGVWSADLSASSYFSPRSWLSARTSIGAQYNRRREFDVFTTGTTLSPGTTTLAGAATTSSSESTTETIVAGTFVEQTIELYERLFVNAAVRFDGGSAFGADFKTAVYPKAGVSWLATDGARPGWPSWVSTLRLRAAFGASGVQPGAVVSRQRDCLSSGLVNGVAVTAAQLCQTGNAELKPERQRELEAGFDGDFFRSRLRTEVSGYLRQSSDAIVNLPPVPSAGNFTRPANIGRVRNRGIEALISGRALEIPAATIDVSLNGNLNENRLLALGAGTPVTPTSPNKVGYPINSFWQYRYKFADANNDKIITASEVQIDADPSYLGAMRPQHSVTGNIALGLFQERLRLSAMAEYRGQYAIQDFRMLNLALIGTAKELIVAGTPLDRQAAIVAITKNSSATSGITYDGKFLRFREISASWTVPPTWASLMHARGAQLSVSARNVGLFLSKYPGFSVESPFTYRAWDTNIVGGWGAPMPRYGLLRLMLDF